MEGLVFFGNRRSYDDFKKQITPATQPLFDLVRKYCLSLGENVVEDVRMHRIVFGKSMTFRWFADVEPEKDGIIIKIQKSRKEPSEIFQIKNEQKNPEFMNIIKNAFEEIR